MKRLICVVLQLFVIFPCALYARDKAKAKPSICEEAWNVVGQNWNDDSALLASARDFMTKCSEDMSNKTRILLLARMGRALLNAKQYDEADAILEQCTHDAAVARDRGEQGEQANGDYAYCWEGLGEVAAYRGWCDLAQTAFKSALDVPTTDSMTADVHTAAKSNLYAVSRPGAKCLPLSNTPSNAKPGSTESHAYGTAFYVSADGLLLTNDHVVNGCKSVTLGTGSKVQIVSRDPKNDLALLKVGDASEHFVKFRSGTPAKVGEPVLAFGFPLPGTLSSGGIATTGIVSSLSGIQDDPRTLQFSAAIQPGNSGGPLFDGSGHVIGVVEAKLDSLKIANATGTIPENVGFAIQWAQIGAFLEGEDVKPTREQSKTALSSSDIAAIARLVTVSVDCAR